MVTSRVARPGLTRAALLALAAVGILILGDLNRRMADAERLERDAIALQMDVGLLETEHDRLQAAIAAVVDDAQVEAWARREAKMVRPGERLMIPVPVEGNSEPIRPAAETAEPLPSPWDVWWALLIGR
ncbi:MAG: hypothetical protein WD906_03305 [Anaerolineales bacterium]